jgi:hypothetical protein
MRELTYFRPSYEVRGGAPSELPDGHRIARTAAAVAQVLDVPDAVLGPAEAAITRVENETDDERRLGPAEVAALAALMSAVGRALSEGIDDDQRPRGPMGERIVREAGWPQTLDSGEPDYDRVFELRPDGRVGLCYPRMSLYELCEVLPVAVQFLGDAAARHAEVVLVE